MSYGELELSNQRRAIVTNITRSGNIVSNAEAQQDIEFDPIEPDDDNPYIEGTEDADLGEEAWHNMST